MVENYTEDVMVADVESINGDILEYENIGAIEGVIRLSGGSQILALRGAQNDEAYGIQDTFGGMINNIERGVEDAQKLYETGRDAVTTVARGIKRGRDFLGRVVNATASAFGGVGGAGGRNKKSKTLPLRPAPIRGGGIGLYRKGAAMLSWKNSLQRMFHTFQSFHMNVIKQTWKYSDAVPKYLHVVKAGQGPALYWIVANDIATGTDRNNSWGQSVYWDGGFGIPSEQTEYSPGPPIVYAQPKKNFGVGVWGIQYVFVADWPGTTMNYDKDTQGFYANHTLELLDRIFTGLTTSKNLPISFKSVFNSKSWTYITHYGTQWRFDMTNYSSQEYIVEITLFRFKADCDAMNYEKQCIAFTGGVHSYNSSYQLRLPMLPITDINIVKRKRYTLAGKNQPIVQSGVVKYTDDVKANNQKMVKWNITRQYVMKRPVLSEYNENLSDPDLFNTYYEKQKGLYFSVMAWPKTNNTMTNEQDGDVVRNETIYNMNQPSAASGTPTKIMQAVDVFIYKKSYFKLDEVALGSIGN